MLPCGRRCAGRGAGGKGEAGEDAGQCNLQAGALRLIRRLSGLANRSFLSGARGDLQVRVGRARARDDVNAAWVLCAGRGAVVL